MEKNKISIEQLIEIQKQIPEPGYPSELKFVENSFLPDNIVVVSANIYKALQETIDKQSHNTQ